MYIFKNAVKSIIRNKGRNILIAIIIIVISSSCAVSLAILKSASNIVDAYNSKNPIEASISMNREVLITKLREDNKTQEEMINSFNDIKGITEEEIINYANSDYIKEY